MFDNFLAVVPIIICFIVIFVFKKPLIAIISGIITAVVLLLIQTKHFYLFESIGNVLSSASTIKTTLFILLVGAMISGVSKSGGIESMIKYLEKRKLNLNSKIAIQLFTMLIGVLMFVDATSSMAMTALVGKPLFQKANIKTEKLALIVNSTASPIAWLIPFGGAGALMTGILSQNPSIGDHGFAYVIQAVPFQFYTIGLLLFLLITVVTNKEIGPLKRIEFKQEEIVEEKMIVKGRPLNMIIPIAALLIGIVTILLITGKGDIMKGDSSSAVFYSGISSLVISFIYYVLSKTGSCKDVLMWYLQGIKSMLYITLLLFVAYIFSDLFKVLGTDKYLVNLFNVDFPPLLPIVALTLAAIISFSTGTSGGTVVVVSGIILPIAVLQQAFIPLIVGAIISGSVFGDQNSIISDSVIMTSSVTGVDTITHVKTQLPYSLVALGISAVMFLIFGFIL